MRNYIILNNKNSNTISGLIIQELSPISKPLQRTQVETIDGRDGDIVTPLGYAAYNKKIKIGLYGTFDINEIIAYFATEGQVVFSNEPDKYYNYQIVDQIDYERLVRYKVATVTMHVQPFKYSATEGTLTIDASDTVSGEGSEIALDNTAEAPFTTLRHKGNATQKTYDGINICPNTEFNDLDGWSVPSTSYWTASGNNTLSLNIPANTNTFHKIYRQLSTSASHKYYVCATISQPNGSSSTVFFLSNSTGANYPTPNVSGVPTSAFTNRKCSAILQPSADNAYIGFMIQAYNKTIPITATIKDMFCVDLTAKYGAGNEPSVATCDATLSWEPYVGGIPSPNPDYPQDIKLLTGDSTIAIDDGGDNSQEYVIPFGDTYLAAIGDYADEPVKVGDTWYIRRAIGKAVLDGTEDNWSWADTTRYTVKISNIGARTGLCDNFTYQNYTGASTTTAPSFDVSSNLASIGFYSDTITSLNNFKTWLGSHPTTVYYALATPTDEEITDQDLIDALDEFYEQAHSYKGRTHITANAQGDNAPAVLSVEVGENNESTVTNAGNTTSRPILTIYGQGDIGLYINDVQVLDIALGDEQYITIDSVAMEAYKDTTENLKNRLVTGDYNKLALNAGANKIYFTGNVTKYEISKYSRWL